MLRGVVIKSSTFPNFAHFFATGYLQHLCTHHKVVISRIGSAHWNQTPKDWVAHWTRSFLCMYFERLEIDSEWIELCEWVWCVRAWTINRHRIQVTVWNATSIFECYDIYVHGIVVNHKNFYLLFSFGTASTNNAWNVSQAVIMKNVHTKSG